MIQPRPRTCKSGTRTQAFATLAAREEVAVAVVVAVVVVVVVAVVAAFVLAAVAVAA